MAIDAVSAATLSDIRFDWSSLKILSQDGNDLLLTDGAGQKILLKDAFHSLGTSLQDLPHDILGSLARELESFFPAAGKDKKDNGKEKSEKDDDKNLSQEEDKEIPAEEDVLLADDNLEQEDALPEDIVQGNKANFAKEDQLNEKQSQKNVSEKADLIPDEKASKLSTMSGADHQDDGDARPAHFAPDTPRAEVAVTDSEVPVIVGSYASRSEGRSEAQAEKAEEVLPSRLPEQASEKAKDVQEEIFVEKNEKVEKINEEKIAEIIEERVEDRVQELEEQGIIIKVNPAAVAQTPTLRVSAAEGNEGEDIALNISARSNDTDGAERLIIYVRDLPEGYELSVGQLMGDGGYMVKPAQLAGLVLQPVEGQEPFSGTLSLTVEAIAYETKAKIGSDHFAASVRVELPLTIHALNDAPVIVDDERSIVLNNNAAVTIDLQAQDDDGDVLSFAVLEEPLLGTIAIAGNQLVFTPYENAAGFESLTYRAVDGKGGEDIATLNIFVGKDSVARIFAGSLGDDLIHGSKKNDDLHGDAGDDVIYGGGGNDSIDGGAGNDHLYGDDKNDTIEGGEGDDRIFGGAGSDKLYGSEGDDFIDGGEGSDELYGGDGNDHLVGGAGGDKLWGGAGDDRLEGGAKNDRLYGDEGDDYLASGDGNDQSAGGEGNDVLKGEAGHDKLWGDEGDDVLWGNEGKDQIWGGAGNDRLDGGDDADKLYGDDGFDIIFGGNDNDVIYGGNGYNQLWGNDGDDKIYGDEMGDLIIGGAGKDQMWGGAGNDVFVWKAGDLDGNRDEIKDFDLSEDKIDIHDLLIPDDDTLEHVFLTWAKSGKDTIVKIDVDGNGNEYVDLVKLKGVDVADLTMDHFITTSESSSLQMDQLAAQTHDSLGIV